MALSVASSGQQEVQTDDRPASKGDDASPSSAENSHHGLMSAFAGMARSMSTSPSISPGEFSIGLESELEQKLYDVEGATKPRSFIDTPKFTIAVVILVTLNTLQMGIEVDYPDWSGWSVVEICFTTFFLLEMIIKLLALGRNYFADHWNRFDCFLVCISVLDSYILTWVHLAADLQALSVLRVLRLFRLTRVLRLARGCKPLVLVLDGIAGALKSTFWVGLVLLGMVYVGAVFCVGIIGRGTNVSMYPGYTTDIEEIASMGIITSFNPHLSFGDMIKSMLTLFSVATMTEWTEIVRPVMFYQPAVVFFFVVFLLVVALGIMNVIIGMIAENVMENAKLMEQEEQQLALTRKLNLLHRIEACVRLLDTDDDGYISLCEMETAMHIGSETSLCAGIEGNLLQLLNNAGMMLPSGFSSQELLCMLDHDGDGMLLCGEFVQSFYRLVESGPFQQICMLQTGINSLAAELRQNQKELLSRLDALELQNSRCVRCDPRLADGHPNAVPYVAKATDIEAQAFSVLQISRIATPAPDVSQKLWRELELSLDELSRGIADAKKWIGSAALPHQKQEDKRLRVSDFLQSTTPSAEPPTQMMPVESAIGLDNASRRGPSQAAGRRSDSIKRATSSGPHMLADGVDRCATYSGKYPQIERLHL